MKPFVVGGLTFGMMAAGLVVTAPPAVAGCQYGGPVISKCDGPVQPDGTWQRCVAVYQYVPNGLSSHLVPSNRCDPMGPGKDYPGDFLFTDPPTHIDG